jgi:hypothetical protein
VLLRITKQLPTEPTIHEPTLNIPGNIRDAVSAENPSTDPLKYLSNSIHDDFKDMTWL